MIKFLPQFSDSSARKWFNALSKREKALITVAGILFTAFVFFALLWPAASEFRDQEVQQFQRAKAELEWIRANESIARARGIARANEGGNLQLTSVSRSANLYKIPLQRIQPTSEGVSVEIDNQSFDTVIRWLFALERESGMTLEQVRISRADQGVVDARIVIR